MEKTWAAVHRRPEHGGAAQTYVDACFGALAATQEPLPAGVVIPDTMVFSHAGWKWYTFSTAQGKVILKPAGQCTSQRIIEHCCEGRLPGGSHQEISLTGDDEDPIGTDIVAVWYSDRRDSRGLLSCVEYFTSESLAKFFVTGERKKLGVLQQFIYPRFLNLEENCNHELLLHWNPVESVVIERRSSRYGFDSTHPTTGNPLHPTQRALVHPSVAPAGKITALTNPFSTSEIKTVGEGLVGVDVFAHDAATLCDHVATSLESMRQLSGTKEGRGVSSLSLSCKFSRDGGFLFLLGVTNLRFPGDHENHELTFDLIPPRTGMNALSHYIAPNRAAMQTHEEELAFQEAPPSGTHHAAPAVKSGGSYHHRTQGRRDSTEGAESYDDSLGVAERDEFEDDQGDDVPSNQGREYSLGKVGAYECPNCGISTEKNGFVQVPYSNLLRSMEVEDKTTKRKLVKLIPPAAPKINMVSRKHGDPPPKRPKSARIASSYEKVRLIGDEAECFKTKNYSWADAPPALKKLNVTVQDLACRPVWLNRNVALCQGCATKYGVIGLEAAGADAESSSMRTKSLKVKPNADRLDRTGIVDRMVLTDLQKYHRQLRRTERDKKEMRDVIGEARAGSPRGRTDEQDLKTIADALSTLCIQDNSPMTAGSTPDAALSIMLMNELHDVMSSICGKPLDDADGEIPVGLSDTLAVGNGRAPPAGSNLLNTPFPPPAILMDVRGLDELSVRAEREKHSGVNIGRLISHGCLVVSSEANTLSRLKENERRLLIEVVGVDRDRPLDEATGGNAASDLGGPGEDELQY